MQPRVLLLIHYYCIHRNKLPIYNLGIISRHFRVANLDSNLSSLSRKVCWASLYDWAGQFIKILWLLSTLPNNRGQCNTQNNFFKMLNYFGVFLVCLSKTTYLEIKIIPPKRKLFTTLHYSWPVSLFGIQRVGINWVRPIIWLKKLVRSSMDAQNR